MKIIIDQLELHMGQPIESYTHQTLSPTAVLLLGWLKMLIRKKQWSYNKA